MGTRIRKFLAAPVFEDDEDKTHVASLLNTVLLAIVAIAALCGIFSLTGYLNPLPVLVPTAAVVLLGLASLRLMRSGRVRLTSVLVSSTLWVLVTLMALASGGVRTPGFSAYTAVILIAGLLLGGRAGMAFSGLSIVAGLGIMYAETNGLLPTPPLIHTSSISMWTGLTANFVATAVLLHLATRRTTEALDRASRNERALAESLGALRLSRAELEARTRDLEHRSVQLQVATEVARDAATARELDEILNRAVNLIRDRFGFYHAGIFLVDEPGEYAVLQAATGEAGRQMLEGRHRLKVGETGIVGYVSDRGEARVALDVGADAVHFQNPLLPETRSEMGLPLRVGERIIGVLDVQSQEEAAFGEDDVAVLQTMADQVAVAIENARLLHGMQETVHELEVAAGRYTQESWRAVVRSRRRPRGYRYQRLSVEPVTEQPPEARQAWQQDRPVITARQPEVKGDGQNTSSTLAVPVKLRGQVVAVLNLRFDRELVSRETVSMVEEVADRLALALENSRLLEESQQRAERDRLIAEITARVRSSMDPETILQTAVRELGAALGPDRAFVQLGTGTRLSEE